VVLSIQHKVGKGSKVVILFGANDNRNNIVSDIKTLIVCWGVSSSDEIPNCYDAYYKHLLKEYNLRGSINVLIF